MGKYVKVKFLGTAAAIVANITMLALTATANTKCWYIYYEPDIPDGIERYRRF